MDKLSGLVIDVGDDHDGAVMRSLFPCQEDVPEFVKSAEHLDPERRAALPDDLYALVLQEEDVTLRKFACADAGNTALNVLYFLRTGHRLPVAAQKTAAANLCTACSWYDMEPPEELRKIALGVGTGLRLAIMGPEALHAAKKAKGNLEIARQSGGLVNPNVIGPRPAVV